MYEPGEWESAVVPIANRGAGIEPSFNVPGSERMLLMGVSFVLTAAAGGSNRTPVLEIKDGSGVIQCCAVAGFALTPGSSATYGYTHGLSEWDQANNLFASGPCPMLPMDSATVVTIHVENLAAGDTLTNIRLTLLQAPVRDDDRGQ